MAKCATNTSAVNSENETTYSVSTAVTDEHKRAVIAQALKYIEEMLPSVEHDGLTSPQMTKDYLKLQLAGELSEVFCMILLDNRHRVIKLVRLFTGTVDGCSVHPRECVRSVIQHNAAAVILAHNHPSAVAEPSQADIRITQRLKDAMALIDVRILDHIIVGGVSITSLAERGLM